MNMCSGEVGEYASNDSTEQVSAMAVNRCSSEIRGIC